MFELLTAKASQNEFMELTVSSNEHENVFGYYANGNEYYFKNGDKLLYSYANFEEGKRFSYVNTGLEKFVVASDNLSPDMNYKEDVDLFIPYSLFQTALGLADKEVLLSFDSGNVTAALNDDNDVVITLEFMGTDYKGGSMQKNGVDFNETLTSKTPRLPSDLNTYTNVE
jgi:hypothetical protein